MIPVTTVLSLFLFGIEELATQLEEPFTILPMQGFCDKIYNWCNEIVSFKPGDNGMPVYFYDNYEVDATVSSGLAPGKSLKESRPPLNPPSLAGSANGSD